MEDLLKHSMMIRFIGRYIFMHLVDIKHTAVSLLPVLNAYMQTFKSFCFCYTIIILQKSGPRGGNGEV